MNRCLRLLVSLSKSFVESKLCKCRCGCAVGHEAFLEKAGQQEWAALFIELAAARTLDTTIRYEKMNLGRKLHGMLFCVKRLVFTCKSAWLLFQFKHYSSV